MPKGGARPGSGRKALYGEPMKTLAIQLSGPTVAQLNSEADAQGITPQELIRERLAKLQTPKDKREAV